MACSSGDQNDVQHKIFLSHAGMEKDFVEQLHKDLENIYPGRVFFDKDSLPYGENFPNHILHAAQNCEVAVIVISDSYFKRKWPMIELAAFVSCQSQFPQLKILPLFYKLSVEEFKRLERQKEWFEEWENLKDSRIHEETLKAWKDALRSIYPLNGIQMIPGEGEVFYRKRIVQAICDMVPPVIEFDVSHVEGKERICTFFREKLEPFDVNCSPCFFGMYAMGGMGKTTMSRVLCNEFSSEFLAKVCHVELNNHATIDLRKALLRTLTKWNEIDMSKLTDESQVRNLLIQHVPKHRLFLVVDNVWDQQNSIQEAKSFLSLPFKKGTVVLVTARSIETLNLFKKKIPWKDRFWTPFLDTHAATNLFLNSAGYKSLSDLEPKEQALTKAFVHSCWFSMLGPLGGREYHPLALRVLGGYVGQYTGPWENIKIDFKNLGENEKIDPLFSVLEIGWESLSTNCRSLFLDIVQFKTHERGSSGTVLTHFVKWYSTIFGVDKAKVRESLEILKRRSILNLDNIWGQERFSVHDLYREFATREANKSTHLCNCILRGRGDNKYYQKKRLTMRGSNIVSLTKQGLCECSANVEILRVVGCDHLTIVDLRGMKDLLSVELLDCESLKQVYLDDLQNLVWLHIDETESSMILSMKGLVSLHILKLFGEYCYSNNSQSTFCGSLDLLQDCTSLLELELEGFRGSLEFPNLRNSKKLRSFIGKYCIKIKTLRGLSNLEELRHLEFFKVGLVDIDGLDVLKKLEILDIRECFKLKAIPNLENMGLTLHTIVAQNCNYLEYVSSLNKLSSLQYLDISGCKQLGEIHGVDQLQNLINFKCGGTRIRYLPDLSMLIMLNSLDVSSTPIEQIGGLPKNLRVFRIHNCAQVKKLPNLSQLSCLQYLYIFGCKQLKEIHGVDQLQNLINFNCNGTRIRYLPDLSMLTTLNSFDASTTPIEKIRGLPIHLKAFDIHNCAQVKELPNLSQLGRLQNLDVSRCKQVEEIHGVDQLQNLKDLNCSGTSIRYLPDLSMLTTLYSLDVSSTPIEQIGGLPTKLKVFDIHNCAHVKKLPNLSHFGRLQNFDISGCEQLGEIHGVDQLQNLYNFKCNGTSIKYLPGLSMLTMLNSFDVSSTPIEQIGGFPIHLKAFDIHNCAQVKELPNLSQLGGLQNLDVSGCKQVEEIHGVDQLQNLYNFKCNGTSIKYLPDLSMLTLLKRLDMSSTPIEQIGGLPENLEVFGIHNCAQVKELPNLSQLSCLQKLNFSGCKQLEEIHGVDQLQNLINFNCNGTSIRYLPDLSMLTTLKSFDASTTPIEEIRGLPIHLKDFDIHNCAQVKELPNLSQLGRLQHLDVSGCKEVEEIHGVDQLQNLQGLNCSGTSIRYLPDLSMLTTLYLLHVSSTPIEQIGDLPKTLQTFDIHNCAQVKKLPNLNQLGLLENLDISGCEQLGEIHGIDQLQNLKDLNCSGTRIKYLPDLSMLRMLNSFDVSSTPIEQIGGLPIHLKTFDIHNCAQVKELPNLSQLGHLQNLDVSGCKEVEEIHGIDQLQNLINFKWGGTSIRYLPDLKHVTMLNSFDASSTPIEQIGGLPENLEVFGIHNCAQVKELPNLCQLCRLQNLDASGCKQVEEIHGDEQLQDL